MTPAERQLAQLQRRYDELEARMRAIECGLVGTVEPLMRLGLTLHEAQMLALLMKRNTVTKASLYYLTYGEDGPDTKIIDVRLCQIRKKLKRFGVTIDNRQNYGWSIQPKNKNVIENLLIERAAEHESPASSESALAITRVGADSYLSRGAQ